jgi:hypothetical protein
LVQQQASNASIKERLVRGLAYLSWIHLHPEYSILHIPATNSNHHPISLNTVYHSSLLPRPFRFEEFWIRDLADLSFNYLESACLCISGLLSVQETVSHKSLFKKMELYSLGNIQKKIKSIKARIGRVQQLPLAQLFLL